jgi:Mg-chelatase subunit ChlD
VSVLLVTSSREDIEYVRAIYGEDALIDAYVKPPAPKPSGNNPNPKPTNFVVPFTVDDLCKYDEIIISDVDVRDITSADAFIDSLDTVVSLFGKTLITAGNTHIQNQQSDTLSTLQDMLPVKFNDSSSDPKLYTLVIDSSRSMEFRNADYFVMAKLSATYLLGLLDETDYFSIINFSGEVFPLAIPQAATEENIAAALRKVSELQVTQGTMIGAALEAARELVVPMGFSEKQIILISDGMSFEGGETLDDDPVTEAQTLRDNGVTVYTLNTGNDEIEGVSTMKAIAEAGGGEYYFCKSSSDLAGLVLGEVADDVNASEINERTPVNVAKPNDSVLFGTVDIPDVYGYVYAKAKASAETVLTVDYTKPGGTVVEVPLYAYWAYGNGRVATLTTTLGGAWVREWNDGDGAAFLHNVAKTNLPETKNDYPYTIEVRFDGKNSHVEITPASVNPDAKVTVTVITPDGGEIKEKLTFDSYRYFYKFETGLSGKYVIRTTYELRTKSYSSETVYTVPYSPEYDSFASSSPAPIYAFMRNNGGVFEDGTIELRVDEGRVATYVLYFTVPFLAAAVMLYVVDTVIRKLKWADVKSLFKRKAKEVKK